MKGSRVWLVEIKYRSVVLPDSELCLYGPWIFTDKSTASTFVCRTFARPLIAWLDSLPHSAYGARGQYLELISKDYGRICELRNYYEIEQSEAGSPYWTWDMYSQHLNPPPENAERLVGSVFRKV